MPKDRRSSSFYRHRASPYSRCYEHANNRRRKLPIGNEKEWEEIRCLICMEHPHNAVLLLCSSREKGCIPYMCDTSSRHSNCLDQFRKPAANMVGEQAKLVCPLCRGEIGGWSVIEPARQFMNSKTRSCSMENCDFSGNYSQLRNHARREHPYVRPTKVNPQRELEWKRLEEEMEQRDMLRMQLEFDEVDDGFMDMFMDDVYELASPNLNYNLDFYSITTFDSDFGSSPPALDWRWDWGDESGLFGDLENIIASPSSHVELESRESGRSRDAHVELETRESGRSRGSHVEVQSAESGRSRGISRSQNRLLPRPRDNTPTTRRRSNDSSRLGTGARRHRSHH